MFLLIGETGRLEESGVGGASPMALLEESGKVFSPGEKAIISGHI